MIMEDSGTVSLHLNRLNNVETIDIKGKKCVVIPVEDNGIYISPKGTIVLSYFMSKMYEEKYGNTHVLKRKLSKEEYKRMSPDDRKRTPDGGYFSPYKTQGGGYSQGQGYGAPQPTNNPSTQRGNNGNNINDLPF